MNKSRNKVYSHTQALCSVCQKKVEARIISEDNQIWLEKFCTEHGIKKTLISSSVSWYENERFYIKPGTSLKTPSSLLFKGCPDSCGYCEAHLQHICHPIVEINSHCNLDCPVCLKDPQLSFSLKVEDFQVILDSLFKMEFRIDVLNLSGGEPTLHPDLPTFIHMALNKGVTQVSVSTHGLEFLHNPTLRKKFRETGTIAALQLDGFSPDTFNFFRGNDLSKKKQEIIHVLESENIRYSLVATVAKKISEKEIPLLVNTLFESKAISLMFQPLTFTGRAVSLPREHRMTTPCVVCEAEKSPYLRKGDFNPLPCSHPSCFTIAYYYKTENEGWVNLKHLLGEETTLSLCANKSLPGMDYESQILLENKIFELWSAADTSSHSEQSLSRIRKIFDELNRNDLTSKEKFETGIKNMKAIFIHSFMDVDTLDIGRLVKCCNPYPQSDGKMIPACSFNAFQKK